MDRPLVIAHRGSCLKEPENTLPAFQLALDEGADGIELDVWRCGSGEIVVTHNRDLSLLTGQSGNVEKLSLTQLRQLDFGKGEKIPTLEEVLELVPHIEVLNIEIKGTHFWDRGIEKAVFQILQGRGMLQRTIVSSFNPFILFRLRRISRQIPLGLIFHKASLLPLRRAWAAYLIKLVSLHPGLGCLSPELAQRARRKNQKQGKINEFT